MAKRKPSRYQQNYAHYRKMGYSVERSRRNAKNNPCYVATAVYGSYDCPEVWTLRRFRDNTLKHTWYGRTFIKVYYEISPHFVKCFGHTKWFNTLFRGILNKIVANLNNDGVLNTPYNDPKL
ncbi:MAG: hypothetical protein IJ157_02315 [Clostridia bacterium]|nr:hypothetical protein [Clostridia bacterium]